MRLADYLKGVHVSPLARDEIAYFDFGEAYVARMSSGKSIVFMDLEDCLSVLRDEFMAAWERDHRVSLLPLRIASTMTISTRRVLQVEWCNAPDPIPTWAVSLDCQPTPAAYIEERIVVIRNAVTMFNLTQSWDQFQTSNL